jgi:Protein of unknown function (DUF3306)
MNDADNFLTRWSRRKREADAKPESDDNSGEAAVRGGEQCPDTPVSQPPASPASPEPEFDVSSLPPVDSIGAETEISAFMRKGVPAALRHAALRRAWSADPAIRDFIGPNENYWDAAGPDGIPGFGDLDPSLDVKKLVSELFGEIEPQRAERETSTLARASSPPAQIGDKPAPSQDTPRQNSENVAAQQRHAESQPGKKITRRHGGAMPE